MEGEKIKKKMKGAEEKENFGVGFLIGRESAEQDKGPEQKVGRARREQPWKRECQGRRKPQIIKLH